MYEIAGLLISGFSLVNDLLSTHRDLSTWKTEDLLVDDKWLPVALKKDVISGDEAQLPVDC